MRIQRFYTQLDGFYRPFKFKYGMKNYSFDKGEENREPVVFFGCYGKNAQKLLFQHAGLAVIVWAGSDSMDVHKNRHFVQYLHKNKHRIFHIAYSHWIKADLDAIGLEYFQIPIFPVTFEQFKVEPLGSYVYHYTSAAGTRQEFYGTDTVKQIMKQVGQTHVLSNKFIIATANANERKVLHEVYKKCFVGIRLTTHDNMAISCVEMALMGRRSIFNGNIPGAIPFKDRSEVFGLIIEEYKFSDPDKLVAEEMRDMINLDQEQWLETDFYK